MSRNVRKCSYKNIGRDNKYLKYKFKKKKKTIKLCLEIYTPAFIVYYEGTKYHC